MSERVSTPDYLARVQAGVDYIESHLDGALTLADIAEVSGMSVWHFQRVFKVFTNENLKVYIRSRRLSIALERLTGSNARILDIALLAGYESQESFTRAFKKVFDITPAEARRLRLKNPFFEKQVFNRDYLLHLSQKVSSAPEIYQQPALDLVGMRTQFYGEESEKNNMAEKLPLLWDEFIPRMGEIRSHIAGVAYGAIRQTSRSSELLEYTAACEVLEFKDIPEGMVSMTLPAALYAKFAHRGLPNELNNTINYIYSSWLMNSGYTHTYGADLVTYGSEYTAGDSNSTIYYAIPIA